MPLRNRANEYLIDRQLQRTGNFTGITGLSERRMPRSRTARAGSSIARARGAGAVGHRGREVLAS
ncbi:MAG: hypothetical protein R3E68_18085 [Burkholderiaceae bacterium]